MVKACSNSRDWLLVNKVLVECPNYDATHAFADYTRHQTSKVSLQSVCFVNFYKCVLNAAVVLCLVFVVVLKVCTRADDIYWAGNDAAQCTCTQGGC